MIIKNQHDKKITLKQGLKNLERDCKTMSCETFLGVYFNSVDAYPVCSISTFGNGGEFEIDVVDRDGHQEIYTAQEMQEAVARFCAIAKG
jgi:hypothetical protein